MGERLNLVKTEVKSSGNNKKSAALPIVTSQTTENKDKLLQVPAKASDPVVVQSLTTSPDGRKFSVFSVTKSAPSSPVAKRKEMSGKADAGHSSADDEHIKGKTEVGKEKSSPSAGINKQPNGDKKKIYSSSTLGREKKKKIKSENRSKITSASTPRIEIQKPSFKATPKPTVVALKDDTKSASKSVNRNLSRVSSQLSSKKERNKSASSPYASHDSLDELDVPLKKEGPKLTPTLKPKTRYPATASPSTRQKSPKRNKLPASENKNLTVRTTSSPSPSRKSPQSYLYEKLTAKRNLENQFKTPAPPIPKSTPVHFKESTIKSSSESNMVRYRIKNTPTPSKQNDRSLNNTPSFKTPNGLSSFEYIPHSDNPIVKPYAYLPPSSKPTPNRQVTPNGNVNRSPKPGYSDQSKTLPRTPKSQKKGIQRSGSSSGLLASASPSAYPSAGVTLRSKSYGPRALKNNKTVEEEEKKFRRFV